MKLEGETIVLTLQEAWSIAIDLSSAAVGFYTKFDAISESERRQLGNRCSESRNKLYELLTNAGMFPPEKPGDFRPMQEPTYIKGENAND